jgi:hypothetical protein
MPSRVFYRAALIRACTMAAVILLAIESTALASAIERISNDTGGQIAT